MLCQPGLRVLGPVTEKGRHEGWCGSPSRPQATKRAVTMCLLGHWRQRLLPFVLQLHVAGDGGKKGHQSRAAGTGPRQIPALSEMGWGFLQPGLFRVTQEQGQ